MVTGETRYSVGSVFRNSACLAHAHRIGTGAAKNREHILNVARDALRESGDASLIGIARRAGVGPGTLYRHFPTREALIAAVYAGDVERLVRSVPQVLVEHAPLDAFRVWFRTLADFVQLKRGLGDALRAPGLREVVNGAYAPWSQPSAS